MQIEISGLFNLCSKTKKECVWKGAFKKKKCSKNKVLSSEHALQLIGKSAKQPKGVLDLTSSTCWTLVRAPTFFDTMVSEQDWVCVYVLLWIVLIQVSPLPEHTKAFCYWCLLSKLLQLDNVDYYPREIHIRQKENMTHTSSEG